MNDSERALWTDESMVEVFRSKRITLGRQRVNKRILVETLMLFLKRSGKNLIV